MYHHHLMGLELGLGLSLDHHHHLKEILHQLLIDTVFRQ
jgi:hypothetical protein